MIVLAALVFAVSSTTFQAGATMPKKTIYNQSGCTGANVSPELHWKGAPANTRSFAIVMHDPDAPAPGGWYHWVVYNLPASTHRLAESAPLKTTQLGMTSWGAAAYGGPCPPRGKVHHYVVTVYALNLRSIRRAHLTGPQVEAAVAGHTLGKAAIVGLYQMR